MNKDYFILACTDKEFYFDRFLFNKTEQEFFQEIDKLLDNKCKVLHIEESNNIENITNLEESIFKKFDVETKNKEYLKKFLT